MLQYDGDALVPKKYLVDPPAIDRTMSEFLCAEGVKSFAISETQKYGHVTYFWNGNRSGHIDPQLETYIEIPSDNVEFDTTPAMKVREITDETIDLLRSARAWVEEFGEEALHLVGRLVDEDGVVLHALVVAGPGVFEEHADEALDRHEGGLEVVGNGVGKTLELSVLGLKLSVLVLHRC